MAARRKSNDPAEKPRLGKGERTRADVRAAVLALMNERPLADILLDDILLRSGKTVGSFYFHYKSKEAVIEEVADELIGGIYAVDAIDQDAGGHDARQMLQVFVERLCDGFARQPLASRQAVWLINTSPRLNAAWQQYRTNYIDALLRRLVQPEADEAAETANRLAVQFTIFGIERTLEVSMLANDEELRLIGRRPRILQKAVLEIAIATLTARGLLHRRQE